MAMGAKAILAVFNGSAFEAAGDRKPSLIKLPRWSLNPWLCENSERAFTEGNRVLLAPRFPSWLAIARALALDWRGRSFYCSTRPSVLTQPRLISAVSRINSLQRSMATARTPRGSVAHPHDSIGRLRCGAWLALAPWSRITRRQHPMPQVH